MMEQKTNVSVAREVLAESESVKSLKTKGNKCQATRLSEFYRGKSILLTGSTGFIGKVCLVKLVRSLSDCKQIYVLLRAKKGLTSQQRFSKILSEEPFISLKNNSNGKPIDFSNVKAVNGDMSADDLGLSEEDKRELCQNVEIFINLAASVSFDAPMKLNLRDNFLGCTNMLSLACKLEHLISLVHVSTFYANSHLPHIEERVVPMEENHEKMAELIKWMPQEICDVVEPSIIRPRPNTYVFTKAMAENLVKSYEGRLPIGIVRPSIVVPSIKDPFPGWVDNVNGPMGLGSLAALGILRNIDWNYYGVADLIPVDTIANSLLAVAERTARLHEKKEIKVYNCSSSSLNPLTWGEMFEKCREESLKAPPMKMLRMPIKPPRHRRVNKVTFALSRISELLFAYFIDFLLVLCGQKRILAKLTARLHHGYDILLPFTTNEYTCDNKNLLEAYEEMHQRDKEEFDFDIKAINWGQFFHHAYLGSRRFLLKEDPSNIPSALLKMRVLMVAEFVFKCLLFVGLAWISLKVYRSTKFLSSVPLII